MDQNGAAKNMNKTETSKKVQYFIITIYNYPRKIQKGKYTEINLLRPLRLGFYLVAFISNPFFSLFISKADSNFPIFTSST